MKKETNSNLGSDRWLGIYNDRERGGKRKENC